jgi:membrane-bound lytic murein transglycosylase A
MIKSFRLPALFVTAALLAPGCVAEPTVEDAAPTVKDFAAPLAPGELALEPAPYADWARLAVPIERRADLLAAIDQSLAYLAKPSSRAYFPYLAIDHARLVASLQAFRAVVERGLEGPALVAELQRRFDLYRSKGRAHTGEVLFTSYCEPIYDASLSPDATFRYPLYRRPQELASDAEGRPLGWARAGGALGASPTRDQIDAGALAGRGLELCWLRDPLEVYLVHVQGSARLRLPDGRFYPVGYAGKTEHPYRSLGKALIRDGKVREEDMNLAAIRRYFAAHPGEVTRYLVENPSYVFFTETEGGPFGSIGARVTARATIATDKSVFPRAAPAFVDAHLGGAPFHAFVLDQDTGGAIRSAGRCDIFAGTGPEAEAVAGATQSIGRLYYFFLKPGEIASTR